MTSKLAMIDRVTFSREQKLAWGWGEGPWIEEPDWSEFEAHGFPCLARRTPSLGTWCGYVAVPQGHPWFGRPTELSGGVDIHGCVTFAEADPDGTLWWVGFDCGHGGDYVPGLARRSRAFASGCVYRDLAYVRTEIVRLAQQAADAVKRLGAG